MSFLRPVVIIIGALLSLGPAAAAPAHPDQPNIVLIFADDLGWGDLGFNGRRDWATPNLDRLATRGTVFTRWYAGATVCAPSRGVLLTGKYTIHNGVSANGDDLPAEQVTIAEALRARGYATGLFGKWHHGRPRAGAKTYVHPMDQGFDEFFGFTDARHAWEKFPKELWAGRQMQPVSGYATTLFTDRGIDFLQRHRGGPFFLYLAYTEPHLHIQARDEDLAAYRGRFPELDPAKPFNATYAAMVSGMDREIGRVLAALEEQGLAESTLVLFTSDQGATFEKGNEGASAFHDSNRPFRGQKRTLWEGGLRVPAVIRWPGHVPAARTSPTVVHMMDVFPTLLAAAGATPRADWKVDGVNMLPAWTDAAGGGATRERTLFWEWRSEGATILAAMRGEMKLLVPCGGGKPELYDIKNDPGERRDLSAQHPELVRELRGQLEAWLATEIKVSASRPGE